ncbi:MAG: hypothetical protein QXD03_03310 [Candidatus Anstonellales archaeon]
MVPDKIYDEGFSLFIDNPLFKDHIYGFISIHNNIINDIVKAFEEYMMDKHKIDPNDSRNLICRLLSSNYNIGMDNYYFEMMKKDGIWSLKMDSPMSRIYVIHSRYIEDFSDNHNLSRYDTINMMMEIYKLVYKIDGIVKMAQEKIIEDMINMEATKYVQNL